MRAQQNEKDLRFPQQWHAYHNNVYRQVRQEEKSVLDQPPFRSASSTGNGSPVIS